EPVRLFIDLEQEHDLVTVFRHEGGRKFLVGSAQGRGFVVSEDECLANTRKGKQVPEMGRGSGVRLQRFKDGGLSDLKTFKAETGLTWTDTAGREFSLTGKEYA